MATDDIDTVVGDIDDWLARHAPELHSRLPAGVSASALAALEAAVGRSLPRALHVLYRCHEDWHFAFGSLFMGLSSGHFNLMTFAVPSMQASPDEPHFDYREAGVVCLPPDAVNTEFVAVRRLPLITDGGGNFIGLDYLPGPAGTDGQVIAWGRDDQAWVVLADSLDGFLREVRDRMHHGRARVMSWPDRPEHPQSVAYLDDAGADVGDGHRSMADFFPGFGAAPSRL